MTKKLLDLNGLTRYDSKLKDFIDNSIEEIELEAITDNEVTALFEETDDGIVIDLRTLDENNAFPVEVFNEYVQACQTVLEEYFDFNCTYIDSAGTTHRNYHLVNTMANDFSVCDIYNEDKSTTVGTLRTGSNLLYYSNV